MVISSATYGKKLDFQEILFQILNFAKGVLTRSIDKFSDILYNVEVGVEVRAFFEGSMSRFER